ncbi:MAG TPA: hypothetical protein EYN70_09315 [Planctomycetaceae bacterium]|nr:hypothetical protein [Planctomycetaceae bacterium]
MSDEPSTDEPDLPILKSAEYTTATPEFVTLDMFNELQLELHQLRAEFAKLRSQVEKEVE